ncbi:MAG TPA: DUF4214 domain-containing protein [Pyrinomonadaceae bacterium]|jgi:hypothetical protein
MVTRRSSSPTLLSCLLVLALCLNCATALPNSSGRAQTKGVAGRQLFTRASAPGTNAAAADVASAKASIEYLARVMDQFHNRFVVYQDVSAAGNHFFALTKFQDDNAPVDMNGSFTEEKHSGATALRCLFSDTSGTKFGGFVFQNGILRAGDGAPRPNFGTEPGAGVDLSGATALTFWARGKNGGEVVDFFMGGVGYNEFGALNNPCTPGVAGPCQYPDSTPAVRINVTLTAQWKQYRIDLTGRNLSYVLGGFGWGVDGGKNRAGAEFYLDDIEYELSPQRLAQRLNEPRLLKSFDTAPFQLQPPPVKDFDLVLRNSAFTYDNAMALLAFLADGTADSLRRARLVGDAFVYASRHDRSYDDGRLRSDYSAGDLQLPPGWAPNGRAGTVPVPGFYDEAGKRFVEVEQKGVDTGNNCWAMIALLALYERTREQSYLDTARNLGNFIRTFRNDAGTYQGFLAGLDNYPESPNVTRRNYASAEHDIDVVAAFTTMARVTGEARWLADARHARKFVEAMWESQSGCYRAGTINPETLNTVPDQLPLDVQPWALLATQDALALHPQLLRCAEQNHMNGSDGFTGFDFNNDRDGVWFEGTVQMAVAYAFTGQLTRAEGLRAELRRAQQTPPFGDGFGVAAASHDGLTTGFRLEEDVPFLYHRRPHVGATSWNVFAQLALNPYFVNENRIDNPNFFVSRHYLDFLGREPDQTGLAFWVREINSCGDDATCAEVKRVNVSAAFYLSIEFKETGYLAYRAHKAAFGNLTNRPVPITLQEFLAESRALGRGVVVNEGDWQARLEGNKRAYFDAFVADARFAGAFPASLSPEAFVDKLDANAGRVLSQAERAALVGGLGSGATSRAEALRAVAEDADLLRSEFNRAFVLMEYFGYLRRNPDDPPDADFGGYNFWLKKLDDFEGNFVEAEMVKAFITSAEYRGRFGRP